MSIERATELRPALTRLSDEEIAFRDAVADLRDREVRPRVQEMERAGRIDPALVEQYFEMGLMGIEVPEQYGGAGGSLMMVTLAVEEMSKVDAAAAIMLDVQNTLVNYPINRYGSEALKAKYLTRLTRDTIGAYALSEPSSGSDAFALATRAERRGDRWMLTGRKMWITNGAEAGIYVVFANAEPERGLQGDHRVHRRARDSRASRSARRKTSSASAPRARRSSSSTASRSRRRTCSARSARATRSRSRR